MRIGIDIDNVISSFDNSLLKEYLEHDKKLRNTGIVNERVYNIRNGMFDWSEEEENEFYITNIERIASNLEIINDADKFINRLLEDGNEIYIISGRDNGEYKDPYDMTKKWLAKNNILYTKLILTNAYDSHAKTVECLNNKIDIMIEDSTRICVDLKENGINVLMMNTRFNQNDVDIERVSSWQEIYSKISAMYPKKEIEKINVILDTDTYNEADDQFALAYLLKYQDRFNIEAITIAPFQNRWIPSEDSGIELSYQEAKKVCELSGVNSDNLIFKGSTDYINNGYNERNEAVDKIIEIALKNKKTYILGIGAITNIALAIKYEPEIIDKIEIIWLGGHTLLNKNNLHEANFKDVEAVKIVFESNVKLTVIPCKGVASNLMTSTYELDNYIKGKSELSNFLYTRFKKVRAQRATLPRWPLWDISVIAYMINKNWFETFETNCPNINDDTSYELNTNNHLITFVNYLDINKIFEDLFSKLINIEYKYDIYLAGTCNNSTWREELISRFNNNVLYVNPSTDNWNHDIEMEMRNVKEQCKYILYVITSEMKGVLAIANLVELANKQPERLLFCFLEDGFDNEQIASLNEVLYLLKEHNVRTFKNLDEVSNFINKICLESQENKLLNKLSEKNRKELL